MNRKIRQKIGHILFQAKLKTFTRRGKKVVSFENAKNIGILYNATNLEDYEIVKQYVKELRSHHKEVLALGFVDKRQLHHMQFAKLGLDFFTRTNLNWHMVPQSTVVNNFINNNFDILINLDTEQCFPLDYIAAFSKAHFRIGILGGKNSAIYDFLIILKGDKSLTNTIQQVDHYLNKIKTNNVQEV